MANVRIIVIGCGVEISESVCNATDVDLSQRTQVLVGDILKYGCHNLKGLIDHTVTCPNHLTFTVDFEELDQYGEPIDRTTTRRM